MSIELTQNNGANGHEPVSVIQLKGNNYQRKVDIDGAQEEIDCNQTANNLSVESGYVDNLEAKVLEVEQYLGPLFNDAGYYALDGKIKHGQNLTFAEAFSLATFVCAALNRPLSRALESRINAPNSQETHLLQATALLSAMSAKEAYVGLTPEEIAGLVAATVHLDTFVRVRGDGRSQICIGGMGGDKGYRLDSIDTKFFSLSTLSAIALSVDGPVHKHHSYPNTSKVAGQSAIESLEARSDFHSTGAMEQVAKVSGLMMSSCHDTRTLHTLSHLLRGETINHVIGPLSFPVSADIPAEALIGVNEKVHPEIIVGAIQILDRLGFQKYKSAAVFCGTDLKDMPVPYGKLFTERVRIDEIAPPPYVSIVAFLESGSNLGTYVLQPEDFYSEGDLARISLHDLVIPNEVDSILRANKVALAGLDESKSRYLAMTIGLGLFVRHKLPLADSLNPQCKRVNQTYLRECTAQALSILRSGQAARKLDEYVIATKRYAGRR